MVVSVVLIAFLFANTVQLAFWDWDQLKIFIGIYLLLIAAWATSQKPRAFWAHFVFAATFWPAMVLGGRAFQSGKEFTVYNKQDIEQAMAIREHTSPAAILAGKPDHNSPVTLTGRRLFAGYDGTLASHGIKGYRERKQANQSLETLIQPREKAGKKKELRPDFILMTQRERRFWKDKRPLEKLDKGSVDFLYRMPDADGS
jgi:hypothetical protein